MAERSEERLRAFERRSAVPMLVLSLLLLVIIVAPLVADLSTATRRVLDVADWAIWAVFAAEYLWRLRLAPHRWAFVVRNPIDLAVVVVPFAQPLRLVRSLRALRAVRLVRVMSVVGKGAYEGRPVLSERAIDWGIVLVVLAVVGGAAVVYGIERDVPSSEITTFPEALWWAASTAATKGTEIQPVTTEGRIVALLLALVGISVVAALAGIVASFFVGARQDVEGAGLEGRVRELERRLAAGGPQVPVEGEPPE